MTQALHAGISERADEFQACEVANRSDNLLTLSSTHPDHPATTRYTVWVNGNSNGWETMVRLSLDTDARDDEIERLQTIATEHADDLSGFECRPDSTM